MRLPWFTLLCCSCLVSCDKVKQAVADARAKVSSGATSGKPAPTSGSGAPGSPIDKDLEALIDRTPEGVRFRKDLPFPSKLTVRDVMKVQEKALRVTRHSELGNETGTLDGTTETTLVWKRDGERLSLNIERDAFVPAAVAQQDPKAKGAPPQPVAVESETNGLSAAFRQTGGKWKAENSRGGDFRRIVWLENVEPGIVGMATDSGALPSPFWFGKPRFKEGTAISLTGDGLKLVFRDAQTGKLDLVYEGIDGIGGHPCGRFSIKGICSQRNLVGQDGKKRNLEYTIDSGKIWLSLLHPVGMRLEMEAVMTVNENFGGVAGRIQGPVSVTSYREWKPGT